MPPPVLRSSVRTNKQTEMGESPADIASLLQLILNRDERRQQEESQARREEGDRRQEELQARREEADRRQQEMAALIAAVSQPAVNQTPQNVVTSQTNALPSSQTNVVPPPTPNAKLRPTITPPQPLQSDVSYQRFRDWRRRFDDYAVMTDLSTLPLGKQHIQLRTCLTPEMLHTLHYRLQVPKDDSTPIADVLVTLDRHCKAQTNEALRRRVADRPRRLERSHLREDDDSLLGMSPRTPRVVVLAVSKLPLAPLLRPHHPLLSVLPTEKEHIPLTCYLIRELTQQSLVQTTCNTSDCLSVIFNHLHRLQLTQLTAPL
ncbi:hypothetical protein Pcinc_000496 [Petrolisthes cinctipes]|uniref:Uncharacterized protein n=1 Tax=Petrolisthes cinctipes TaxID=88211 RepID=A0AAE1GM76_PETCI|nr:hypothetical protein Pcinc_000496 [Petrolisthes cinctipes]